MKLTDFLNSYKVPYLALTIKITDGVKDKKSILEQTPTGWKDWDYEKCMEYNKNKNNCKHLQVNLSKSPFMVMDNDDPKLDKDFRNSPYCDNEFFTTSISKGLTHAWFKKDENDCSTDLTDAYEKDESRLKDEPYLEDIDLRYTNIFENSDAEINVPCELREFCFEADHPKPKHKNKKNEQVNNVNRVYNNEKNNEDIELMIELGLLDDKLKSYTDWFDVLCAFKRVGIPYFQFDEWSMRCNEKYDSEKNKEIWDKTDVSNHGYNMGSIINWCKAKDEKLYNDYFNYYISPEVFTRGNLDIANHTYKKFRNLVYCNDKWFRYDKHKCIWYIIKDPTAYIIEIIHKHIDTIIKHLTELLLTEQDTTKKEELRKAQLKYIAKLSIYSENKFTSQFSKILKEKLYDSDFEKKLDNLKNRFAFQNGMFDMNTATFRYGLRYNDYLTDYVNRDFYFEEDKEKLDFIEKTIFNICNSDEEQAEYYKSVLGYSLCGDAEKEKEIYFIIGQGANNGKTTLLEAMKDAMPSVVGSMNNQVLLANYSKAHKFLPMLEKKIIYVEELQKGKELNTSLLKEIRDGKSLSNEVMFGTSKQINISAKVFILSNNIPVFKTDNGISTCLRQLQFNNKFLKEESEEYYKVGNVSGYLKADKSLADKLKGDYFIALLNVLLKYSCMYLQEKKLKPIPKFYIEKAKETCNANDTLNAFWEDEIIFGENYKLSKEQLMKACSNKEILDFINDKGYVYDKNMKNGHWKKGGWRGITLKDNIEDDENEE